MKDSSVFICINKGVIILVLIISIIAGGFFAIGRSALKTALVRFAPAISGKVILIDAGHGGIDGGAVGVTGLVEKDVVLDIALRLRRLFKRAGVYVVMTREDDRDLADESINNLYGRKRNDLNKRVDMINKSDAVLFISIHANSFPESIWSGAQTFYPSGDEESVLLAQSIQGQLVADLGPNNRKAKSAELYILENSKIPGVLVEVGFLSNPREEGLLKDPDYREKVAIAIRKGTERYLIENFETQEKPENSVVGQEKVEQSTVKIPYDEGFLILYFANPSNLSGELVPEVRQIFTSSQEEVITPTTMARLIVNALIKGPNEKSILLPSVLPETKVRDVYVSGDTAYVDFDGDSLERYRGGSIQEMLAAYSIINSLVQITDVNKVQFSIDGEKKSSLGGHIYFDEPFEKDMSMVKFDK